MKLLKALLHCLNEVTGQIIPLWKGNRQVWNQIKHLERCKPTLGYPLFNLDTLLRYLHEGQARRQIIEDKAKTNVLGITLAFTVILATLAFAPGISEIGEDNPNWLVWPFMALQTYGMVFLLTGGWLALKTLRVAGNYIWTLSDEREHTTAEARNTEISWYLQINEQVSTLKSNLLEASYNCIRNGMVALAASATIALILLVLSS